MKKINIFLSVLFCLILISCSKDEQQTNLPPSKVGDIEAEVVDGTTVKLSWNSASDPEKDQVFYNVVVNRNIISTRLSQTSIEFDVASYLEANKSEENISSRGIGLELVINITALDTENNISEESEVKRYIFINRKPGEFEFININFDFYNYNYVNVEWSQASDIDGDILSYNVYLNNDILVEDYIIGDNSQTNTGHINVKYDYSMLLNKDITIKVIANDRSGGEREIMQTYNFKATDVKLGSLNLPYQETQTYLFKDDEIDNKIGYMFTLTETTGISITDWSNNVYFTLTDIDNNYISSGKKINVSTLPAGSYYLEVEKNYKVTIGSFVLTLRNSLETDINLGTLSLPYTNDIDLTSLNTEPDGKIKYSFEMNSSTSYVVNTNSNIAIELLDDNNKVMNSNYNNSLTGFITTPGLYHIVVSNKSPKEITESLNISFNPSNNISHNENLGNIETPYVELFNYDTTTSTTKRSRINFNINSNADYNFEIISANHDTYLYLYSSNGILLKSNNDGGQGNLSKITGNLSKGSYYLEITGNFNSVGTGILAFSLE